MATARGLIAFALLFSVALECRAEESLPDTLRYVLPVQEVSAKRLTPQQLADKQPGFVSVFDLSDGQFAGHSASEVLARASGAHQRDRGGLGRYSTLSLRGGSSRGVPVYLDGMPLTGPHRASLDFSTIDLAELKRMEVHRGAAPLAFGGGSLGGAVHLFSASGNRRPWIRLDSGSYGEHLAEAGGSLSGSKWSFSAAGHYLEGQGSWEYFDDKNTIYNPNDDEWAERANNFVNGRGLRLYGQRNFSNWTLAASETLRELRRGEPGLGWNRSITAREEQFSHQFQLALQRPGGTPSRLREIELTHRIENQSFHDLQGDFGYPSDRSDDVHSLSLRGAGALRAEGRRVWQVDVLASELTSTDDAQARGEGLPQRRITSAAGLQPMLDLPGEVQLSPGARVELHWDRFHSTETTSTLPTRDLEEEWRTTSQLQLGLRRSFGVFLFKANLARAQREPTLLERFGARGGVLGNPKLQAESGILRDVGFIANIAFMRWEATYFHNDSFDLISFVPVAPGRVRAANVSRAETFGTETSLQLELPFAFRHELSFTWLNATDRSDDPVAGGKRLIGQPDYDYRQRTVWTPSDWELWYELSALGESFLETGERNRIAPRTLHSVGIGYRWSGVRLGARVQNLADEEIFDFWGYPLPGRTLHVSLGWSAF